MVFQIVDDILIGEQDAVPPARPLITRHPACHLLRRIPSTMWTCCPHSGDNPEHMERLIENIRRSDAVARSMREAEAHVDRALTHLESLEPSTEREALENLARYIVDRKV
jgi:geranylgeranyl pyrophosphate synthase